MSEPSKTVRKLLKSKANKDGGFHLNDALLRRMEKNYYGGGSILSEPRKLVGSPIDLIPRMMFDDEYKLIPNSKAPKKKTFLA